MKVLLFLLISLLAASAIQVGISDDISIGGLSSGAFMAVQTHVALSKTFRGAAIFAGGPYYCSMGDLTHGFQNCMADGSGIVLQRLINYLKANEKSRSVDETSNLKDDKVYLFTGTSDNTVHKSVGLKAEEFYKEVGADIMSSFDFEAGHTMPTEDFGVDCLKSETPFIGSCNLNGALVSLQHLHPHKIFKNSKKHSTSNIFAIDQNTEGTVMGSKAYAYIPSSCQDSAARCSLHVVFHGCQQTIENIGMKYVENTGYNKIAEANDFVILYPQAAVDQAVNPLGCWDWWGYTDRNFATKMGKQISEVKRLVELLKSGQVNTSNSNVNQDILKE
eukprot:CAMPEP_0196996506 /NCGR_PEP_ID=MMETSP1380-20130617/2366_1 /TAXON_ID=5936 /ORGANISM="Euplotes crassus, Strain CT5" /LENGTH=332 /DNA_ID=CAMNT_0042412487 /DNA_START=14 /DNA_END=1012 /DNA_ORIENTATION=-